MLLEALSCVDQVIIFDEDTPEQLIGNIRPDILVKGDDYKSEDVVERHLVDRTVFIPRYCEVSTTQIINECHNLMIETHCRLKRLATKVR